MEFMLDAYSTIPNAWEMGCFEKKTTPIPSQKKIFLKWHWAPPTVIRFRYSSGVGRGGPGRKFPAIEFEDRFRKYDLFTFRWLGTVADVLAAVRRATGAFMKAEYAPPPGGVSN